MAEIHKCGQGWAYCDGNCTTCAVNNCYTTNGTITLVKDYPPYLDYPKERKKQTNADKFFRNATDEELAERLENIDTAFEPNTIVSQRGWLDWLKQEVESDG
jgi:hypothetical protein